MVAASPFGESSSTPAGCRKEMGLRCPSNGSLSYRRSIAFLVVDPANAYPFTITMFQTFPPVLYHWHDVRSSAWPDVGVPQFLPDRKGPFGQLASSVFY